MKENLAISHRAHPAALLHLHRVLHLVAPLHLHRVLHLVPIKIVAVKIYQRVVAPVIDAVLPEMFHRAVKPVIHAGFGPHRWKEINLESVPEFLNQIFLKM
jgi:hypothetical protein